MTFASRIEQLKAEILHSEANRRNYQEKAWDPSYKELYDLYCREQLSQEAIARKMSVSKALVQRRMADLGIASRSHEVAARVHWKRGRRSGYVDAEEC